MRNRFRQTCATILALDRISVYLEEMLTLSNDISQ